MKYKYKIFILIFLFLSWKNISFWAFTDNPTIIPRASWGANSQYNNLQSESWQEILAARKKAAENASPQSEEQIAANAKRQEQINSYFHENFAWQFDTDAVISSDANWNPYAWKFSYADTMNAIVVHHTDMSASDSVNAMQKIHRFHSLSRQWGDIGYHYLIGENGEIYEGREWGDYVMGAHSYYNNGSTLGIALIGNYQDKAINEKQYESLKQLIYFLCTKYWIDLNEKYYYHMNCAGSACNTFPVETKYDWTLVWHRDTGHTNCPGDTLWNQISQIREELAPYTQWLTSVIRGQEKIKTLEDEFSIPEIKIIRKIENYDEETLSSILKVLRIRLLSETDENRKNQYIFLQNLLSRYQNFLKSST